MPDQETPIQPPMITELSALNSLALLRADSEQQQQQQQQQQAHRAARRFLNAETQLPQEEIVTKLTVEVTQVNSIQTVKR